MIGYLLEDPTGTPLREALLRGDDLHAPAVVDLEFASALRRAARGRPPEIARVSERIAAYRALPLQRHSHEPLLERVLDLPDVFSAYDAAYVALAEQVGAALLTEDRRLARAIRASRVVDVELA